MHFDHAELASQVLEQARDILQARLHLAEGAIIAEFQGEGGGSLYAADLFGADPGDPELQTLLGQIVSQRSCECLGWRLAHGAPWNSKRLVLVLTLVVSRVVLCVIQILVTDHPHCCCFLCGIPAQNGVLSRDGLGC